MLQAKRNTELPLYETYVTPQWVKLLDVLGMARRVINVI
jgi:hypothetical protein